MPTIVRDGTTLAYEERGSGSPAFVFVHGWTCNRSFFKPRIEGTKSAARGKAPSLHIAATNMLEAPAQVNGMIEGFLRHHV